MSKAVIHQVTLYPLKLRLRDEISFVGSHDHISRSIVVAIELQNGIVGYGEAIPYPRMNPQEVDELIRLLENIYFPAFLDFHPQNYSQSLEVIESLTYGDPSNKLVTYARAAVELALIDLTLQLYHRSMDDVVGWMGLPGFGRPGSIQRIRYSGVLVYQDVRTTISRLRRMYWYGLREFTLMISSDGDWSQFASVIFYLKKSIARGRTKLRLQLQGEWDSDKVNTLLHELEKDILSAIVLPQSRDEEFLLTLSKLPALLDVTLVHDVSNKSIEDVKRVIDMDEVKDIQLQISGCGGLLPSLRLAALARRKGKRIHLGFVPGETSLLTLAGLHFLEVCPGVVHAQGCQGKYLLREDLSHPSLSFRYGGKPPELRQDGTGLNISPEKLRSLCADDPYVYNY